MYLDVPRWAEANSDFRADVLNLGGAAVRLGRTQPDCGIVFALIEQDSFSGRRLTGVPLVIIHDRLSFV